MQSSEPNTEIPPEILAPAGNQQSFLAAVAAGADAIYCGLKTFSARMKADNFTLEELSRLTQLARQNGIKVNIAFNILLKPTEIGKAQALIGNLARHVKPDALIFSDPAVIELAAEAGYSGELHLSTLGNLSFHKGLQTAVGLKIDRVVLPRELSIEEIRTMADNTPASIGLECFVHGALCFGVSGRCYWSSWFGGKSGLRGQCVQPCRRIYTQNGKKERFFSCQDFSADVLVNQLKEIQQVRAWKIEGRKKGPHYVYHTVLAYRLLRDHPNDEKKQRQALELLEQALGRQASHFRLEPENIRTPIDVGNQTGSGKEVGKLQGGTGGFFLSPAISLESGDLLRIGYEDTPGHFIHKIRKPVAKGDKLIIIHRSKPSPEKGTPVFLIDRRVEALQLALAEMTAALGKIPPETFSATIPAQPKRNRTGSKAAVRRGELSDSYVERRLPKNRRQYKTGSIALWLSEKSIKNVPPKFLNEYTWWLPPVIWPSEQSRFSDLVRRLLKKNVTRLVLNAPWQISLIRDDKRAEGLQIWGGPFCNIANGPSIRILADMGFDGIIVSPELSAEDYMLLPSQSILPLGFVLTANWPMTISRTMEAGIQANTPFTSPQGETSWYTRIDGTYYLYPNWKLDFSQQRKELERAGFRLFVHLNEPIPRGISLRSRPGLWNWDLALK